ncbi:GDSL esterase/lipase [Hordeum vulgare]|nr:GDSL esterase/lipase [Hordeum vulgare]
MQRLYDMGARRVVVTGTGPLGCAPAQVARSRGGECDADLTSMEELNARYGSRTFIAASTFRIHLDFISDPAAYGFQTATEAEACCGQGPHNGVGLCTALSDVCVDRDRPLNLHTNLRMDAGLMD